MMDGAAIEQILSAAKAPRELNGFILRPTDWIADDPASLIKPGPAAKTLTVSTLGAVRDYLKANRDGLPLDKLVVYVESPSLVWVGGALRDRSRDREFYVSAKALDLTASFLGKYMALEDFILGVQVRFADVDDRKRILSLLSNVKHETVKTAMDDGVTQVVQARAGVALVSDVAVPNPVLLCGYRTFRDVVQPASLYVLRVQAGRSGGLPEVGLFEADGGAWQLTAIERVREWLIAAIPTGVSVLA